MSFLSTRGSFGATASQAILRGIAPDGGLFTPVIYPEVDQQRLIDLQQMTYPERALKILKYYLEDYSLPELQDIVKKAYGDRFDTREIAPLVALGNGTHVLELFHGPTLAFKDMALQVLPHLMTLAARKNELPADQGIMILAATSGDTGKAALEGFKDVPGTACTVFYPRDGVSEVQKRQMVTTGGNNTRVIAVEGNFDDTQTGVKQIFGDAAFAEKMAGEGWVLSSANSINFGRLAPQIVYYFSAYADLMKQGHILVGDKVNFVVPTGNFGDILAGYYAKRMGLPINKLICASNTNNVLTDFFATGTYSVNRPFHKTSSPSMDILVSSNLERLLFEVSDRDGDLVSRWMKQLKNCGSYTIGGQRQERLHRDFAAGYADDRAVSQEIAKIFNKFNYLCDTHTAVAFKVLEDYRTKTGDDSPAVVLSTASPYKFARDVLTAIDPHGVPADAFACAERLAEVSGVPVPRQVAELQELPVRHTAVCGRDAMREAILG